MAQFLMLKCNLLVFVQKTLSALSRWAGLSYFYQTRCNILIFVLSQQLTTPHQVRSKGAMLSKWIEYQVHYNKQFSGAGMTIGGTVCCNGGPVMAAMHSPGGPYFLPWMVRGD